MKSNTPLTINEIRKIKEEQLANESAFKDLVVSVFSTLENTVYRIVDGKISYQPSMLDNLARLAKEIGNQNLLEAVTKVRASESDLALQMDITQVVDKETNTYKIVHYNCIVTTNLPKINTHNNSFFQQDIGFHLSSDVEGDLVATLQTNIKELLEEEIDLYLIKNETPQTKYQVSDKVKNWSKKKQIDLRIDIPKITIVPKFNTIYLNIRLLNDTAKIKGTHKIWNYTLTEEEANVFFAKPTLDNAIKKVINNYIGFVEELRNDEKDDENTLLLESLKKEFANTRVCVDKKNNDTIIRINLSDYQHIRIAITAESHIHYRVIKTIPESEHNKHVVLLQESYEKSATQTTDIVSEAKIIYNKVTLLM